ncbi:hypothetical protein Zmor_017149 [Zophobas morio]|uniref:Protein sleepless n=1 Tax=Zophobas morio TaxID=2755281 RepID=A0AA38I4R4_9CUCU|nr:hypothetical protein Zmor_017149 [Zophobas morio]
MKFAALCSFFSVLPYLGNTIVCYRCQTGYVTSEVCSNLLAPGFVNECDGPNSQCFESIQWFNNGALRLAMRDCWTPPENTTGGFCENYQSPEGILKYCRNCTQDLCNMDDIYQPVKLLNCDF